MTPALVSIHGGHSGQFCSHASDTLEEVIQAYMARKFSWVGITEHMPPVEDRFMYAEERAAGFTAETLRDRFHNYMTEARRLQKHYADRLEILVGFETEAYSGAMDYARQLRGQYRPDYIIGGIHHVADISLDSGPEDYRQAVAACGGITNLYCRYFDLQYEMIETLQPEVMAHFDLIRIFDPQYHQRWQQPKILACIRRNLQSIADKGLILDFNVAALRKGASEPYISAPILEMARDLKIPTVPGDDSHGAEMVGAFIEEGIAVLRKAGLSTNWEKPKAQ